MRRIIFDLSLQEQKEPIMEELYSQTMTAIFANEDESLCPIIIKLCQLLLESEYMAEV